MSEQPYSKTLLELTEYEGSADNVYVLVHKSGETHAKKMALSNVSARAMSMEFIIKDVPDEENPLEQPVGKTLTHPDFVGRKVGTIAYSGGTHTRQLFTKEVEASSLTLIDGVDGWIANTIIIVNFLD